MTSPLVSCILPVYNGEKYLAEAIESVLKQRYESIEIIVADDGSTDGTAAVAGRYAGQVRYLRQPNAWGGRRAKARKKSSGSDTVMLMTVCTAN